MAILALAAMDKLIRRSGAKRVGEDAKAALQEVLETYADNVTNRAVQLARHGGRTTIKSEDVKLAAKQ